MSDILGTFFVLQRQFCFCKILLIFARFFENNERVFAYVLQTKKQLVAHFLEQDASFLVFFRKILVYSSVKRDSREPTQLLKAFKQTHVSCHLIG